MSDLLKNLNEEQKSAVTYGDGPLLIVAGAGTGKTMVITHRIAYLIEKGLAKPEEIVALAFTEKSAGEMEERIDKLLPYGYTNLQISTFHSFCQKLLEEYGIEIGLPEFKILDNTGRWLFFRKNFDKFDLDYYKPKGNPNKFIKGLLSHFSRLKDENISPKEYLNYTENIKLNQDSAENTGVVANKRTKEQKNIETDEVNINRLVEVANAYHIYQNLLLENGYLDFGDLINYVIELFKKRPNILEECRNRFKYILIDEFQDTNWAQYELIKLLCAPKNNLTVVGDDDQSIYKFRGASLSNILQFKEDFSDAKEVVLVKNYRNIQDILDLSYKFIKQNDPNRLEARLKLDKKLISQISLPSGKDVQRPGLVTRPGLDTTIQKPLGGEIAHLHFNSLDDEIEGVIENISELKNKDSEATFDDFAILVRANDSATPFCQALARRGIPFQFMSLKGLYSKTPILDVLSYLKLIDNYHESPALYRVLSWPFWNIKPEDLMELSYESAKQTKSLFEVGEKVSLLKNVSDAGRAGISKALSFILKHTSLAREKTPTELIIAIIKDTGYLEYLNNLSDREKKDVFDYLNQFINRIKKFEETNPNSRIRDFLEELNLEIDSGEEGPLKFDPDIGPEMVRVMTVHSAKGLEFKYVFLVNLVDRRFPTTERREQIEIPKELIKEILPEGDVHLEEERRLFYVGVTRAKQGLYLTSAEDYGGARKKKLSRFLVELGFKPPHSPPISRSETGGVRGGVLKKIPRMSPSEATAYIPKRFSFTQYIAHKTCPLQYKFRHIIRIPTVGSYMRSFGVTMHNTLQKFVSEYIGRKGTQQAKLFGFPKSESDFGNPTYDELLKIYQKNWIDEWYPDKQTKEKYFKNGKEILKVFYENFVQNKPNVKFLEQAFTLKLGNIPLKGKVDRIDEESDGVTIIDYKTGKPKTEKSLNKDDKTQLLLYQVAVEETLRLKPKKLVFYYLEDGSKVEFLGNEEDKKKVKGEIINQIEEIKKGNFSAKPGMHCKFCDYKDICESREL